MKKVFKLLMLALVSSFALASCEDVPEPYPNPSGEGGEDTPGEEVVVEPAGSGTLADPYNVAAIVALINNLESGAESTQAYYIKGKVKSNSTSESTISQYGNMTFDMIDEGNTSTVFKAFQVYGPGNKKFTSVDQIKEGDEVVVYGKVVNYQGNTPETVGKGAAYVYSINSSSEPGTDPVTPVEGVEVTCAQAAELCNALEDGATSTETYSVTGYITDVYTTISKGQQSFWMADTKDGGKVLQAYWANLPEGVEAFTKGSKVKITGQLLKYVKDGNVTAEIKNADVVILEAGSGDNGGNGDQPATGESISCAKAAELAMALEDKATSEETYTVTGYITETNGTVSQNQQVFWMADTKDGGKVFEGYWANIPAPYTALPVGTKIQMTGKLMRYGSTPEMKNGTVVVLEKAEGSDNGGSTDQPATGDAGEYGTNISYTGGSSFDDDGTATVNGVESVKVLKIGTSSKAGDFTITAPTSGKITFYAVTWKGQSSADVQFKNGDEVVKTVSVKGNDGATGNSPYTITLASSDKYEVELPAGKTITITSDKRILFIGMQSK